MQIPLSNLKKDVSYKTPKMINSVKGNNPWSVLPGDLKNEKVEAENKTEKKAKKAEKRTAKKTEKKAEKNLKKSEKKAEKKS